MLQQGTLQQHRKNIISKISMRSDGFDRDFATALALEWEATEDKFILIQELGLWDLNSSGVDAWVDRVERHLERVLSHRNGMFVIKLCRHRLRDLAQPQNQNLDMLKECIQHIENLEKDCSEKNQDNALSWLNR